MATYKYRWPLYDNYSNKENGYIQFNITPEFGQAISNNDPVMIDGVVRWNQTTGRSIQFCYLGTDKKIYDYTVNKVFTSGKETKFSMSITLDTGLFASMSKRIETTPTDFYYGGIFFYINDQQDGDYNKYCSVTAETESNYAYTYLKYRLTPAITSASFERTNDNGTAVNDGNRVTCRKLNLSLHPQAVVGDITKATIAVTAEGGASPLKTVTLATAQLSAMLGASGYTESKPALFSGVTFELSKEYYIDITIGDAYDQITYRYTINRAFALVDFARRKSGGFAIGMYSNSTDDQPMFEVAENHESHFYSEAQIGSDGRLHGGTEIVGVNSYQTGEHLTGGRWIDGKPIYRYGVTLNAQSTGKTKSYPLPFEVDTLLSIYGGYYAKDKNVHGVFPDVGQTDEFAVVADVYNNQFRVLLGKSRSISGGSAVIEYTRAASSDPALPEGPEIFDGESYPDAGVARADYIAMMAGIEIPEGEEADVEPGAQADPNGTESPGIDGEPTPSAHYDTVARYYKYDRWNEQMVKNAVGRWITADESESILTTQKESE